MTAAFAMSVSGRIACTFLTSPLCSGVLADRGSRQLRNGETVLSRPLESDVVAVLNLQPHAFAEVPTCARGQLVERPGRPLWPLYQIDGDRARLVLHELDLPDTGDARNYVRGDDDARHFATTRRVQKVGDAAA